MVDGGNLRSRWRREVLRTHALTDTTKLLLVVLTDYMDPRGEVSIPRDKLADQLDRSPRRITERIKAARDAGFLDTVSRAYPGHTAVYVATFPSRNGGRNVATNRGADGGPPLLSRMSEDDRLMVDPRGSTQGKRSSTLASKKDHPGKPAKDGSEETTTNPLPVHP